MALKCLRRVDGPIAKLGMIIRVPLAQARGMVRLGDWQWCQKSEWRDYLKRNKERENAHR